MSVIRIKKTENFVILHKGVLEDNRLSFKAKGLWAYCMSRPNDWTFNVSHLSKVSKDGEDAIYSALKELIEIGYVIRTQINKGKFEKMDYEVYETPQIKIILPLRENPQAVESLAEKPELLSIDPVLSIEEETKESATPPSPPLSRANAAQEARPKSKQKKELPREAEEMTHKLFEKVRAIHPKAKPPKVDSWIKAFDLLHERDGRLWSEIAEMIDWAFDDAFWVDVIQSPDGLRRNWDKMAVKRTPKSNKGISKEKNKELAIKIKSWLTDPKEKHSLHILEDKVYNSSVNDSAALDLPQETFRTIIFKWYGIKGESNV